MKFGVQELCDRYSIKSRKSLYSRLDGLSITLAKDGNKSYATDEQVKLLDAQHEYLKNGGTLKNFVPTAIAEVTRHNISEGVYHKGTTFFRTSQNLDISDIKETTQYNTQLSTQSILLGDIVKAVSIAIAEKMTPPSPTWYLVELERIRSMGVAVPTSEIRALIGVQPKLEKGRETFERGSYVYYPDGKIGRERAWKIFRKTDIQTTQGAL